MFPVEGFVGVYVSLRSHPHFRTHNDRLSLHIQILQNYPQSGFSLSLCVKLSSIEEVNPSIETSLDYFFVFFLSFLLVVEHVSKGDHRDLEATVSKISVNHNNEQNLCNMKKVEYKKVYLTLNKWFKLGNSTFMRKNNKNLTILL